MRLGVLVSGAGSILEAMLERGLPVGLVGADRECRGLEVARSAGVAAVLVDRQEWGVGRSFDRRGYSVELARVLGGRQGRAGAGGVLEPVDVVAMAGFGTVLDEAFFEWGGGRFCGRVLNTHPSLLPAFGGWHAVRDALAAGSAETGCTVHVAVGEVDAGPVLAQRAVPVLAGDSEAALHERIKTAERELYPATVAAFMEGLR